jgi:Na+/phosphate symporter
MRRVRYLQEASKRHILDRLKRDLELETSNSEILGTQIQQTTEEFNQAINSMTKRRAESEREMGRLRVLIADMEKELLGDG